MKLSVIIPCYNAERYLPACLDAVLAQSEPDFEVILVDDGSQDGTLAIARSYAALDARLTVLHQENAGVCAARNLGLDRAQGEWVTFVDADDLLVDTGRVPPEELQNDIRTSDFRGLPGQLAGAVVQARETLGSTGDPQLSDFVLDRAYFEDMFDLARESGSEFLAGYVRICIDVANLKSLVRTLRMGKDVDFLKGVLFTGGNLDVRRILNAVNAGSSLEDLYAASALRQAAEAGEAAISGGGLTRFEKLCDDAVMAHVGNARYVAFGEAPLVAYLAARESEFTAVRIIMTGRLADLSADVIRERLREPYV